MNISTQKPAGMHASHVDAAEMIGDKSRYNSSVSADEQDTLSLAPELLLLLLHCVSEKNSKLFLS